MGLPDKGKLPRIAVAPKSGSRVRPTHFAPTLFTEEQKDLPLMQQNVRKLRIITSLFFGVVCCYVPVISHAASTLPQAEQEALAEELFREIAEHGIEEPEIIEHIYLRIMEEAPDTALAEQAHLFLSNTYAHVCDPPRYLDAIELLENYLLRYPESTLLEEEFSLFTTPGLSLAKSRLLFLYEKVEAWEKAASLFHEVIPDPTTATPEQLDLLDSYGIFMEWAGRVDEAILAYHVFLARPANPDIYLPHYVYARSRLEELGADFP